MEICGGFYSFFEDVTWLPMHQASQGALAKNMQRQKHFISVHAIEI